MSRLTDKLRSMDACHAATEWAATQPDLATAWRKCSKLGWMIWLAQRVMSPQVMTHVACDFAETAFEYADPATLTTCILTTHIAREWADGREDMETRAAAWAAAWAADAAADAAYAAAWDAAWAAAWAADAAASAAYAAAWDAAWAAANRRMIRLLRKRIPAGAICRAAGVK